MSCCWSHSREQLQALHSCWVLRGEGFMAMRSMNLLAGALALLWCESAEAVLFTGQTSAPTPAFVIGFGSTPPAAAVSRKRPRGCCSPTATSVSAWSGSARPISAVAVQVATAGSFTARSGARGGWFGASSGERTRQYSCGAKDAELRMGIQFNPPEWSDLAHGFAQAVLLGIMGGTVPRLTKDRIREKEAGLDADERFEMGLDRDDYEEDEFGYAEGYVCAACDNTNEVECGQCRGKGFFVSESALPKKCGYCAGLGTLECRECSERREVLRQERARRTPPLRLPPGRDDDFPFGR